MTENFASRSVPRHLVRGLVGFGSLAVAVAGVLTGRWYLLALVPVGLIALRGCPMCWTIGLLQTLSAGRLRRECRDGHCELTVAPRAKPG